MQAKLINIIILLFAISLESLQAQTNEEINAEINQIVSKIWETSIVLFPQPEVILIDTEMKIDSCKTQIFYYPLENSIYIGTGFAKMCLSIGREALAIALGHEIGHYYNLHKNTVAVSGYYLSEIENSYLSELSPKERNNYYELETQADLFAAFHCYSAGYDISDAWNRLIDTVRAISSDSLSEKAIADRKSIACYALSKIKELEPISKVAKFMYITSEYEFSAKCFEYLIANNVNSPDIVFNAANAYLMAAIACDDFASKLIYPFEMKRQSVFDTSFIRNIHYSSDRGMVRKRADMEDYRSMLISKALLNYSYLSNNSNLHSTELFLAMANAYALAGNNKTARYYLLKAEDIAKDHFQKNLVQLGKGIVYLKIAPELAESEFIKAGDFPAANHNLRLTRNALPNQNIPAPIRKNENIGGIDLASLARTIPDSLLCSDKIPPLDSLQLKIEKNEQYSSYIIKNIFGQSMFIESSDNYSGESLRKIKIGSNSALLTSCYGQPDNICFYGSSAYYVYEQEKIAFEMIKDKVASWFLYLNK